jgi:hypothetical protein
LIAENEIDIPFDLRHLRAFFYKYEPDSMLDLQKHIRMAILEIIGDRQRIDNSVRRYLFERETRKLQETSVPPRYDVVRDILAEMTRLREDFLSEVTRLRSLVTAMISDRADSNQRSDILAEKLQGIWRAEQIVSIFCSRILIANY